MIRRTYIMVALALACAAVEDPGGWTKAKWGMTDDQVLAAFPGQAARLDPPELNGARVSIKSIELSGAEFRVYFIPDAAGHLRAVILNAVKPTGALFQSLENLLVAKYGRPWKTDEAGDSGVQWSFPTTVITLTRVQVPNFGTQFLSLAYKLKVDERI
ncbi:MAG TPA: hypothetical protein VME43_04920 [Bryobacteraceae bacterium]|nr:hypothetical protein [Bryobacteraceae bacterium]